MTEPLRNSFDRGPEGWCSYDYHWSIVAGGRNIFVLTAWEESGGVGGSGYVWSDQNQWSADTPEAPISMLPLLVYTNWTGGDPVDLRGARVSAYLRGDGLLLNGASCYFWVVGRGGRWHMTSQPLHISDGRWADEPNVFTLHTDESLWHRSWSSDSSRPPSLESLLSSCRSYGFSFVGFGAEPTGKLALDEFQIQYAG
jgi:hypothetical protein